MELKWLEDFLNLAETGSFSRSAEQRHITQPAFSRRIRALEAWLGADLIDRGTYPTRLTPSGETFKPHAVQLLARLNAARAQVREQQAGGGEALLSFAVPHTLAFAFFPGWIAAIRQNFAPIATRLIAGNVHDAVMTLVEGGCDLLLCYHHPSHPVAMDPERFEGLCLASESVRPYVRCDARGRPRWRLPGSAAAPIPFLGYGPGAYLWRMVETILERAPAEPHLALQHQTDMAESLKAMMLAGHGLAFLPASAVAREEARGEVVEAGDAAWTLDMEVRLYRDRLNRKPLLERLLKHIAPPR